MSFRHWKTVKVKCLTSFFPSDILLLVVMNSMSIQNIIEKGELLDAYGDLLTERQRDSLDLYYNENLTLAEIAEHFHISRQAVHDAMRHGEEQLSLYEKTLHLVADGNKRRAAAQKIKEILPKEEVLKIDSLLNELME